MDLGRCEIHDLTLKKEELLLIGRQLYLVETHEDVAPFGFETEDIVPTQYDIIEIRNIFVIIVVLVGLVVINNHA